MAAKIRLRIFLPEQTIQTGQSHTQATSEEYLLIQGLPIPSGTDYWRFWTRQHILEHLLTVSPTEQMISWLDQLQERHLIEDYDVEELETED